MKQLISFIKKELVLSIAVFLAVLSSFFVKPDEKYIEYIDMRTILILFALMAVIAGFKRAGVFEIAAGSLIMKAGNEKQLVMSLVMMCFFSSMLITNDVALITFVPLSIAALDMIGEEYIRKWLVPLTVMETIAANMGSMLTPVGNPQNLYLSGKAGLGIAEFILLMLPYTAAAFLMLCLWIQKKGRGLSEKIELTFIPDAVKKKHTVIIYTALFVLCLLAVADMISYMIAALICTLTVLLTDKKALKEVDYSLLATFAALFIFIGNMSRNEDISGFLYSIVSDNEILVSVASSQIISNVPAAVLLSGFTYNYELLIIGTNIGGLGTLIASMASLISFRYVVRFRGSETGKYMGVFTLSNLIFMAVMACCVLGMNIYS